jgi:hypothetical protein
MAVTGMRPLRYESRYCCVVGLLLWIACVSGRSIRIAGWGSCGAGQTLERRMKAITAACCPANSNGCADGTPTRCTATCAEHYLPFYKDCHYVLLQALARGGSHKLASFGKLEQKCASMLGAPTEINVTGLCNAGAIWRVVYGACVWAVAGWSLPCRMCPHIRNRFI